MKTTRIALIALTLTAAAASNSIAFASDLGGKTRAQVHAEWLQAQRNGTLIANDMTGATLRELYPSRYPAAKVSSLTRAQVRADLEAARRNGTLIANGQTGATFRELNPSQYPPMVTTDAPLLGMGPASEATRMN